MPEYRVSWCIDIEADDVREAAQKALAIQRNSESHATVFQVRERSSDSFVAADVDLLVEDDE